MEMGASSKYTYKRIAEYCDGWFPIYQDTSRAQASGGVNYADGIEQTKAAWSQAGRSGEPDFSIFGVGPDAGAVERLIADGFNRIIFALPPANADTVLPLVENYAALAHQFNQ